MLGCWVAEFLFLMWNVVVAREIETKEERKERKREREREEREISFFLNIILFDNYILYVGFDCAFKYYVHTQCRNKFLQYFHNY